MPCSIVICFETIDKERRSTYDLVRVGEVAR